MKRTFVFAALALVGAASAQLYTNGYNATTYQGIWDNPTGGNGGNRVSVLDTAAGGSIFGYGAQTTANNTVADDFTVAGQWSVTGFSFFMYQTGATTPTISSINVGLRSGSDVNTASTVFAPTVLAATSDAGFLPTFRATDTAITDGNRRIWKLDVTLAAPVILNAGQYWLTWNAAGSLASGPWQPPVVPHNGAGNGMQQLGTAAFLPLVNGSLTNDELPFGVNGSVVPEPATMAALGLGFAAILRRRKKA